VGLIFQGEANEVFYFVQSGCVALTKDGKEQHVVKPNDYFGEVELLKKSVACFTATAAEDSVLLTLNEYSFNNDLEWVKKKIEDNI
jgi:CRP-like cAMP-binding protein